MSRFPRCEKFLRQLLPWFMLTGFSISVLRGASIDYATYPGLAGAKVNIGRIQARYVSVAEVLALVENQTGLKFVYDADRLPMAAEVRIESQGVVTAARLLAEVSAQVAIVFRERSGLVAVWAMGPDDVVAPVTDAAAAAQPLLQEEGSGVAEAARPVEPAPVAADTPATVFSLEPAAPAPAEERSAEAVSPGAPDIDLVNRPGEILQMEKFTIQGDAVKGSASALRALRTKADVAVDFLSADQIAKYSAGDLAEIVIRIPGVSVAGGQFAVIRGLSDRYTNTTFNGLKLPSPDPERQSPQLDILPTTLVDSIVVSKSFAPYLWADTSGGSIDLTNAEPDTESRRLSISYGVKVNDNAQDGGPRYEVPDRRNDWIAAGSRSRPGATLEEFRQPWDFVPQHDSLPLGQKFSMNYSDGFQLGKRSLGLGLAFGYEVASTQRTGEKQTLLVGHKDDVRSLANSEYRTGLPTLLDGGTWDYEQSKVEATVSGLASTAFELSEQHKLRAVAFWTRTGSDSVQANRSPLTTYKSKTPSGNIVETQVAYDQGERRAGDYDEFIPQAIRRHRDVQVYTERKLGVFQLAGSHEFEGLGGLKLDWVTQRASTYQNEPNLVDARYYYQLGVNPPAADGNYGIPIGEYGIPQSGTANLNRFWGTTHESQGSFRIDGEWAALQLAGRDTKLRFGVASEDTERTFDGSNYTGVFHNLTDEERTGDDPDEPFNHLVAGDTPVSNSTEQARDITATYLNLTVSLPGRTELVAGARFERFAIDTVGKDEINRTPTGFLYHYSSFPIFGSEYIPAFGSAEASRNHVTRVSFTELNWHPSLGLIYRPTDSLTVRATASKTSGRPSLREMGPYYNRSLESGEYVVGNPFLRSSEVVNFDTRVEWVRSNTSRYAASLFAKRIKTPIEKVFLPGGVNGEGVETWSNNPNAAKLYGAEFEFQQGLGWGFSLGGNFTWIKAEVEEHPAALAKLRADFHLAADETIVRPLFDQPEYLANLDLSWSQPRWGTTITLTGNAISDVLETAGGGSVFGVSDAALDIYDRASHRLDFSVSQLLFAGLKLKFNVTNLTDPAQGTIYDPSRTPEELIRNTYHAGRNYSLTLSKTF